MTSVGIDVSKGKSTVCILRPYGEIIMSPREFEHTESSMNELIQIVSAVDDEVRIVMESTGSYHFPVATALQEANLFVAVINPIVMKRYATTAVRKGKTDKLDSVKIANYGLDYWLHLEQHKLPEEAYAELKLLGRQYHHYNEMKVKAKLALFCLLDRTMPGIKDYLKNTTNSQDKVSDFVEKWWHFDCITKHSETFFVSSYCKWAKEKGYRQDQAKATKIYALAKNGIPTLSARSQAAELSVREAVRTLRAIEVTLHSIISEMDKISRALPEYQTVRAMKGVGDVMTPRLIAEIGDVKRFYSGSALVAYAGIDAPPHQSGKFEGTNRKISKRGSPYLRKTCYEVMRYLKNTKPTEDSAVYDFILKKEAEGKPKKSAKIAGINKFLRIYYARVKEVYASI